MLSCTQQVLMKEEASSPTLSVEALVLLWTIDRRGDSALYGEGGVTNLECIHLCGVGTRVKDADKTFEGL